MRKILGLIVLPCVCLSSFSQRNIPIDSVQFFKDQLVQVCAKVDQTFFDKETGTTFLNLGGRYPNAKLVIVIFIADLENFSENPEIFYRGKRICVTGVVKPYKDGMEIAAKDGGQIKLQ